MSDEFSRELLIKPGYDYRDEPKDKRGAHGCDMFFILRGPLGAITARIGTGWMAAPLAGHYVHGAGKQERLDKPGVDLLAADMYPTGIYTGAHSIAEREGSVSHGDCDVLPGRECWETGGYLYTDEIVKTLVTMGSSGVWLQLESLYREWIEDDPATGEQP